MNLYDKDHSYSPTGVELEAEAKAFLDQLFPRYLKRGCSPHEIGHLLIATIQYVECLAILESRSKPVRKKR